MDAISAAEDQVIMEDASQCKAEADRAARRGHWRTAREGYTLVPLVMYFNHRGMVKLKIGVGKGKKNHDKRETAAKRDWQRQKARLMKDHG